MFKLLGCRGQISSDGRKGLWIKRCGFDSRLCLYSAILGF